METTLQLIKITKNFQVTLPAKLRNIFKLKEGDYLEANVKNGAFVFKPKKMVDIDSDQAWFWTDEWQEKERQADEDIKKGNVSGPFDNIDDCLNALKNSKI